jgi:hypothetical protein
MFLFGWTAVLATALGFFGTAWWPLDVLADWRMILAAVLVVAAVVTGLGYSRSSAVVFLAAAIVNALLIAPMWLTQQELPTAEERLRVTSLDLASTPVAQKSIIDWAARIESDLIVLANAGPAWTALVERSDLPYRVLNDPGLTAGTLVLARNGVTASVLEDPSGYGEVDVVIITSLGGQELTIVGLSVTRPVSARSSQERVDRFGDVNAALRGRDGAVVLVGNIETSRWSHAFAVLSREMVNSEDGFGYMATYPSRDLRLIGDFGGIPVDHALYRGPLTVTERRISPNLGLDHRALVIDLAPAQAAADG